MAKINYLHCKNIKHKATVIQNSWKTVTLFDSLNFGGNKLFSKKWQLSKIKTVVLKVA